MASKQFSDSKAIRKATAWWSFWLVDHGVEGYEDHFSEPLKAGPWMPSFRERLYSALARCGADAARFAMQCIPFCGDSPVVPIQAPSLHHLLPLARRHRLLVPVAVLLHPDLFQLRQHRHHALLHLVPLGDPRVRVLVVEQLRVWNLMRH
ncbi:hypothetical protein DFJ74DRAFT_190966 [Hyaloraphidium curvatum]|nr:hypothetical protein DFJ74DRAFT_190966 [Hyaloraphidium curvatum]